MRLNECSCGCGGTSTECNKETDNYMFFGNLQTIKRFVDRLLMMNQEEVDEILSNGHSWAVDHIASAADDIQEVGNFLMNMDEGEPHMEEEEHHMKQNDPFAEKDVFLKTFESYINEVSHAKWREVEHNARERGYDSLANRISAHNKKHGTGRAEKISFSCYGENRRLDIIEFELNKKPSVDDSIRPFEIVAKDANYTNWGTITIYGSVTGDGRVTLFQSEDGGSKTFLLAADRKSAMDLIKFLIDEKVAHSGELDWRKFTDGYTSFGEAYRGIVR